MDPTALALWISDLSAWVARLCATRTLTQPAAHQ